MKNEKLLNRCMAFQKCMPFLVVICIALCAVLLKHSIVDVSGESIETKKIALTFDDGPGKYTEKLLDGLKERNVKATFFLIGVNVESYKDVVERMHEDGHIIGNHTYNHVRLTSLTDQEACREVNKTNNLIYNITGTKVDYIRPPFGEWNEELECLFEMTTVLWSVDPLDWSIHNTDKVVRHIVKNTKNGSIILLHDTFETSVDAALRSIDELKKQGYEFVTIDELVPKTEW